MAVDGGNRGFFTASGTKHGSLSPSAEFPYGGANHEVVELRNSIEGALLLGLEAENLQGLHGNLALQLGDRYFPLREFDEFDLQVGSDTYTYGLGNVDLGWSAGDSVEARILYFTVPGAPTRLVAAADGPQAVDLSWIAPEIDGGGIGGYRVEASEDNGASWRTVETNTGSPAATYRNSAHGPGRTRIYRISAVTVADFGNKVGPASDTASATTPHGIASIEATSAPVSASDTYLAGETVEVTVTMSTPAELIDSSLDLEFGGKTVVAVCETQSDGAWLRRRRLSATPCSRTKWTPTGSPGGRPPARRSVRDAQRA